MVDADLQLRRLERSFLGEMGYTDINEADTATEGWTMIKHLHPDAVISGWDLPEMSGLTLLKIMRADTAHAHTPYILVMDDVSKTQVLEAGEAGVSDILARPFNRETFIQKVNEALYPEEDPEAAEFQRWYDRAVGFLEEGRFVESLDMLEKCLAVYENAEVYYNMGYIKTALTKYDEALKAFRKATQIDKDHARAYHMLSVVFGKLGQAEESRASLEKAVQIYAEKNLDEEAEKALKQAMEFNPETINIFNSMGIHYRRLGRFEEAKKYYHKAIKVTPQDEHIYYNLARVYADEENYTQAQWALKKALKITPGFQKAVELQKKVEQRLREG